MPHRYNHSLFRCWPLCFVPLMLSRERQVRLVCPFCGHNYGNYAQAENKSDDPWHPRRGQRRLVEITSSKLDPPSEREHELNPNSELAVLAYQGLWEVRNDLFLFKRIFSKKKKKRKRMYYLSSVCYFFLFNRFLYLSIVSNYFLV